MPTLNTNLTPSFLSKEQLLREAVLLMFSDPLPKQCGRLEKLTDRQWQRLLPWLDISGLALYFLIAWSDFNCATCCRPVSGRACNRISSIILSERRE